MCDFCGDKNLRLLVRNLRLKKDLTLRDQILEEAAVHCETTDLLMPLPDPNSTLREHGANVCLALAAELRALKGKNASQKARSIAE